MLGTALDVVDVVSAGFDAVVPEVDVPPPPHEAAVAGSTTRRTAVSEGRNLMR